MTTLANAFGKERPASNDPFSDFTIVGEVLNALADELNGATAFAESPQLRDSVHNLTVSLENLRGARDQHRALWTQGCWNA